MKIPSPDHWLCERYDDLFRWLQTKRGWSRYKVITILNVWIQWLHLTMSYLRFDPEFLWVTAFIVVAFCTAIWVYKRKQYPSGPDTKIERTNAEVLRLREDGFEVVMRWSNTAAFLTIALPTALGYMSEGKYNAFESIVLFLTGASVHIYLFALTTHAYEPNVEERKFVPAHSSI